MGDAETTSEQASILLVDNSESDSLPLTHFLSNQGYSVRTVSSGQQAFVAVAKPERFSGERVSSF